MLDRIVREHPIVGVFMEVFPDAKVLPGGLDADLMDSMLDMVPARTNIFERKKW